MGVPATGRPLDVSGNDLGRVQDGKLVELWTEVDTLAILERSALSRRRTEAVNPVV